MPANRLDPNALPESVVKDPVTCIGPIQQTFAAAASQIHPERSFGPDPVSCQAPSGPAPDTISSLFIHYPTHGGSQRCRC